MKKYLPQLFNKLVNNWQNFVLSIAFIISLGLAILIAPFDKPDEDLHFFKAVAVSQGNLICPLKNNTPVNWIPNKYYLFVSHQNQRKDYFTHKNLQKTNTQINEATSCVLPFIYYLIPGALIFILDKISLSIPIIFYGGRIINLLFAFSLIYWSCKNLPKQFKFLSLLVLILPMTMFQLSSYSKDVFHLSLGIFLFNESLKYVIYQQENKLKNFIFIFALLLFIISRPQYFGFALLSLLIPFKNKHNLKIRFRSELILFLVLIQAVIGLLWYLFNNQVYLSPHNQVTSLSYSSQIIPKLQFFALIHKPWLLPKIMLSGLYHYGGFYLRGLIGIFGWVDRPLPELIYILYFGLIIKATWQTKKLFKKEKKLTKNFTSKVIAIYLLATILSFISIFLAMYLYASPVENFIVYGIQGRYFLMILAPLILCLGWAANKLSHLNLKRPKL